MTSSDFYNKFDKPSTKPIPKELMNECIDAGWSRSKISQFWEMRKNLGEPKTSADLDEVEEDTMFENLWNKEHPVEAHHSDTDHDYDDQDSLNPSSSTQIQRGVDASTKLLYRKGAEIVEKMGYQGSGGLGLNGEGVWLPPQPLAVAPKHGQKKKMIFPSLPFSFGGFAFERRGFKVAEAFFSIF